jgi:hypothetical protein
MQSHPAHAGPAAAEKLSGLRRWNGSMGLLHLVQGLVILAISSSFSLPVTSSFLQMNAVTEKLVAVPNELARLRIGPLVAAFLLLSALAHALLASPWLHRWYERNVARGINPARWMEYALSSSLMMVVIAMLVGIYDIASLILIFALNATMILFGWLMELHNQTTPRTNWTAYLFGCFAGAVPWVARSRDLPGRSGGSAGVRVRNIRLAVRLLQRLRGQHAPSVQARGPLARLPLRRARLHAAQPVREVRARLAGLCRNASACVTGLRCRAGDGPPQRRP